MKFKVEKNELQDAIAIASRAAASKSPIPALEGLLLNARDGLKITGYDLKEGIYTNIEAEIEVMGEIVVNARLFGEMIRRMPDGIVVFESDDEYNINVKCGKSEFNFAGLSPEDYPELPTVDGINNISMPQKILKSMINQTVFAVADTDVRPIYTGELFEIEDKYLTVVACDGYRLAKRKEMIEEGKLENCTFVVPGSALSDVERTCGDADDLVEISVGKKHISFVIGNTVIVSRRLEGEFLNYRKSIPQEFKYNLGISRAELISTIERVALVIKEKAQSPVRMTIRDGAIDLKCMTVVGKAEDVCLCEGNGDGLEIGFNDKYLTDALKASGVEELKLCLNTASTPGVITAADGTDKFTYMILPVRLRAGA